MTDYLYNLPNATSGMDSIVGQIITEVPSFTPLVLLFVFFVVAVGGIVRQTARTGTADYPLWLTIGSLCSFLVALFFSVSSSFINLTYLVVTLLLTILFGIWLFLDQKASEI